MSSDGTPTNLLRGPGSMKSARSVKSAKSVAGSTHNTVQPAPRPQTSESQRGRQAVSSLTIEKVVVSDQKPAGSNDSISMSNKEAHEHVAPSSTNDTAIEANLDPLEFERLKRDNISKAQMKKEYPSGNKRKLKKYYTRQNELIDQFLGAGDEERLAVAEEIKMGPKIKFAVNASFVVNFCLFIIQLYAAVSTGSLSLFATAADAFMDLVSSFVMFTTSRMAARPSIYKYPVGRTRIETIGIILFCALMTTVAIQLLVESGRALGQGAQQDKALEIIPLVCVGCAIAAKSSLMCYCFFLRRYPSVHVFFIDHRNDIVVNVFGLIMSIVGDRFVWYLDPIGAICIAMLILFSWVANAFEQVWLLVGKTAPREFISKLVYICITHDPQILKVDTCRAYHAGQKYYVEVDVVMDAGAPLKITHDVSSDLQRKLEGLADVERAFVHVDYEHLHDIGEEHKPLYQPRKKRRSLKEVLLGFRKDTKDQTETADADADAAAARGGLLAPRA